MAVKIPIVTVFDSKGLRQAQFQLNKVSGNISNLSRNFAIAGAAFGGIAIGLGKSVKVASDLSESINAVNVAFGSSAKGILDFGKTAATTLGVSSLDFNNAAVRFSAFAERIVGKGGDASKFIAEITTRASDFASVFNIDVSEALQVFQSGLAGEAEPLKRFGINLLDTEVKAFAVRTEMIKQGETMTEQQKVLARYGLLMESTNKTAGDFANTSSGLANASRILSAQIVGLQGEIGDALLPAIEQLMPVVQELTIEFGDKLKTAVSSVDWASLLKSVADLLILFVTHIETIIKVISTLYLLNTAYNIIKVTSGLVNVATTILGNTFTITAGKIGLATGAVKLFRTALITTGIGALVVALGYVIAAIIDTNNAAEEGKPYVDNYGGAIRKSGDAADWAAGKYGVATKAANDFNSAVASIDLTKIPRTAATSRPLKGGQAADFFAAQDIRLGIDPDPTPSPGAGSTAAPRTTFAQTLQKSVLEQNRTNKLLATGLSEGAAQVALSTVANKTQFQKLLTNLSKPGTATKRQAQFERTAAGIAEIRQIEADNEARAASDRAAEQEAERQRQAVIAAEKAAADERARIYKAFADSVTNTFTSIKDVIVGAFSLPELGGSTDSIIRNMDKLLSRVKSFSQNITKLSSMGLNPTLLAQVIQAGPVQGARLAASLVAGGADALARINTGFGDIQSLGSEIGLTGTQSRFGTAQQQQIYNVTVNGGLDSSASIGKAVVDAIKAYERTSGVVFQGA
jgi:hypothetical protein